VGGHRDLEVLMNRKSNRFRIVLTLVAVTVVGASALAAPRTGQALRPLRLLVDLAARVDLTSEQRAQLRTILESHRDEVCAIVDAECAARLTLRQAIQQSAVDEPDVRAASAEVAAVDARLAVERARIFTEVAVVLTPEQKAAVEGFIAEVRPMIEAEVDRAASPRMQLEALDLTDAQRKRVREILASHRSTLETLAAAERVTREALVAAIRQPEVDESAVRDASAEVAAVDADLAVERARLVSEIATALTPEQSARARERIEQLHASLLGRAMYVYDLGLRLL
jgi:Spy/CpxP family protein refolding chaperone